MAPIGEGRRPALVVVKSAGRQGSSVLVLGWREGGLEPLAEGPAFGLNHRWVHVIGAADVTGDGIPELLVVNTPHVSGVLVAYERRVASLIPVSKALGLLLARPRVTQPGSGSDRGHDRATAVSK